ncbi:MAG: transporter substrate-binding domain-containing protein [Clostridiales bacterium]|nr:transporter substrate-binding domain-containing protein [Clostridiales bacterium]
MKRFTKALALLLALALCAGLCACGTTAPTDPKEPAEPSEPADAKTFTVGFDAEFPPFGFIDENGGYDGFDLALAQEVCNRLGWTFVAQPIAWDAKDAELAAGNIDCIWNGFTYQGREDNYTWSDAYYDNSIVMVVRADSGIASLADLAGKNVIVQADSSALNALENDETGLTESFAQLLECADYNSAFMELEMGTADAVAVDVGVAAYNMKDRTDFVILDEPISSETYAVGFLKGNDELAAAVNEQLKAMAEDGTMSKIAENYVDYGLVTESLCMVG